MFSLQYFNFDHNANFSYRQGLEKSKNDQFLVRQIRLFPNCIDSNDSLSINQYTPLASCISCCTF